jgi:glutathione S-transferase
VALILVIGNKNYSSWSFRPWLGMRVAGVAFEEVLLPFGMEGWKERVLGYSPAGRVPVLLDGDARVWESLAILEHVAERFPDTRLWPDERGARAEARSVAAEMHAGFAGLRGHYPMNMRRQVTGRAPTPEAERDIARVKEIWRGARERWGGGGPFLFGRFSVADAMFAPVASRFLTYGVAMDEAEGAYVQALRDLPAWREWEGAARAEPWIEPHDEVD